jgi:tetratricopeptide (TPR) repeat protein
MDSTNLDKYVQLLSSPDANKRRQAIVALGRSKNLAALRPLAEVYRNDQDQTLRELALKAGQFIKAQAGASVTPPAERAPEPPPAATPAFVPPFTVESLDEIAPQPEAEAPRPSHRAPATNSAQAKAYAEEALTLSLRGDVDKAIKALKKAYRLQPNLLEDTYYMSMATTILHCDEAQVPAYLQDANRAETIIKTSAQEKTEAAVKSHIEEASNMPWLGVSMDLIIFGLIMAIAPVVLLLIVGQSLQSWALLLGDEGGEMDHTIADILAVTQAIDVRSLLLMSATFLVSGLVSVIVQCVAIHYSMTRFLGGKGTLRYLMYKLISYYNRVLITVFVVLIATTWVFVSNGLAIVMIAVFIGLSLFGLFKLIRLGDRLSEAYKFTSGGGCMSVVIAGFVLVVSNGAIAYIVYLVLGNVLAALLPSIAS